MPISIWNLRVENTHVLTPIAKVIPVNNTAQPRFFKAYLSYTSYAAHYLPCVDPGCRRISKN